MPTKNREELITELIDDEIETLCLEDMVKVCRRYFLQRFDSMPHDELMNYIRACAPYLLEE